MRALLDTSVLIGAEAPGDLEGAISAASLAELHFGVLVAEDEVERGRRAQRLGVIEATFDPLPVDAAVAREWGRLAAAIVQRGGQPRRRAIDLAIAATANVAGVPLLTHNAADFTLVDDLVEVLTPSDNLLGTSSYRSRSRGRTKPTRSAVPGSSAFQLAPGNASVASAAVGYFASSSRAPADGLGEGEREHLHPGVVADQHHGPDIVRSAAQALEQLIAARPVHLALDLDRRRPERRLDPLQRLARTSRRRAQHQLWLDPLLAQVPGKHLRRAAPTAGERAVVIERAGLPARLRVPQQVDEPHRAIVTTCRPGGSPRPLA